MIHWVLRWGKRPLWYRDDGPLGPRTTPKLDLARRFASADEARKHHVYSDPTCQFEPELASEEEAKK